MSCNLAVNILKYFKLHTLDIAGIQNRYLGDAEVCKNETATTSAERAACVRKIAMSTISVFLCFLVTKNYILNTATQLFIKS